MKTYLRAAFLVLCSVTDPARAALVDLGNGLINDPDSNLMWVNNANLFLTQAAAFSGGGNAFKTAIINANGGVVIDTPNSSDNPAYSGSRNLTINDFNTTNGSLTWWGAQAWIGYLNSINYKGYNDWRLPTTSPEVSGTGQTGSELGHMFYTELGGVTGTNITAATGHNANYNLFTGFKNANYWTQTEAFQPNTTNPRFAWQFFYGTASSTTAGTQNTNSKANTGYAWAVRTTPVPVPAAFWLFTSALAGLAGIGRREMRRSP